MDCLRRRRRGAVAGLAERAHGRSAARRLGRGAWPCARDLPRRGARLGARRRFPFIAFRVEAREDRHRLYVERVASPRLPLPPWPVIRCRARSQRRRGHGFFLSVLRRRRPDWHRRGGSGRRAGADRAHAARLSSEAKLPPRPNPRAALAAAVAARPHRLLQGPIALGKALALGAAALVHPRQVNRRLYLARAAQQCGVVARFAGMGEIQLYGN